MLAMFDDAAAFAGQFALATSSLFKKLLHTLGQRFQLKFNVAQIFTPCKCPFCAVSYR